MDNCRSASFDGYVLVAVPAMGFEFLAMAGLIGDVNVGYWAC